MKTELKLAALCLGLVATALFTTVGHAQDDPWRALREDPEIRSGLTVVAVGRRIDRRCDSIDVRPVRAFAFLQGLVGQAEDLGYSRTEIEAYVDDAEEQERYTRIAQSYFAERGVGWDDPEAICQLGRAEIEARSPIGRLLRDG